MRASTTPTGRTVALVSLTTGNPDDPDSIVTGHTWLIGDDTTAEAFRAAMTRRYGKPVQSMQPGDSLGTDDSLIIVRETGEEKVPRG